MPEIRRWTPGRDFTTAIPGRSWWRRDDERTITAVVVVPPRLRPAWDGGEWTEDELWTIRLPYSGDADLDPPRPGVVWMPGVVYMLHDKPHRVSWWAEGEPGREVLERVPVRLLDGVRVTDRFGLIRWENGSDRRAYRLWRYRNRRRWWIDV